MTDGSNQIEEWLERESRRVLSDAHFEADPALISAGWQRRFITDAQRAQEVMDLYAQLGYEVRAEPVPLSALEGGCEDCRAVVLFQFKTIYTRKR